MTTLSVVQYANTSPHKLNNVLQQSNREIIVLRKPQPLSAKETKVKAARKTASKVATVKVEVPEGVNNPPPVAVARRNARERNRVKQVNNGFATLRQHIPNSIAAAFESQAGRGNTTGSKKLSKVETLRMAVEYIRSLEDILSFDDGDLSRNSSLSTSSFPSPSSTPSSSPAMTTTTTSASYQYPTLLSPACHEDDILSPNSQLQEQQFIRINTALGCGNTYQFYDDSENLEPLDMDLVDANLMDTDLGPDLLNSINTTGSLSPDMYSEESLLSPPSSIGLNQKDNLMFIPLFNTRNMNINEECKFRISPASDTPVMVKLETEMPQNTPPVIAIKHESELPNSDSKENMIQVMAWWEQQTRS